VQQLADHWKRLEPDSIFRVDALSLGRYAAGWARRLVSGGLAWEQAPRSLLDTRRCARCSTSCWCRRRARSAASTRTSAAAP